MGTVTTLRRINPTLNELDSLQRVYADVRGLVWRRFGGRFEELAALSHLHLRTVESFAWGDTKRPQFETIFKLMVALDLEKQLLSLVASDHPITVEMAKRLKTS